MLVLGCHLIWRFLKNRNYEIHKIDNLKTSGCGVITESAPPKSYETLNFVDLVTSPPPPLAPGGGVGGVGKN